MKNITKILARIPDRQPPFLGVFWGKSECLPDQGLLQSNLFRESNQLRRTVYVEFKADTFPVSFNRITA